jgi:hypothetical protein
MLRHADCRRIPARLERITVSWKKYLETIYDAGFATDLHRRPSIVPRDLVPAELLLTISVPDVRVDVMVVKHPAFDRIVVDTLATRTVDVVVRFEHNSTTT